MKNILTLFVLLFGVLLMGAQAGTKQAHQSATVVSVANHETPSNFIGEPSDAPLRSEVYSYDIGIQLNCTVYVVRYETGLDYLPSVFAPHHTVEVTLQKNTMSVNLPGAREVRLGIGSRSQIKDTSMHGYPLAFPGVV